jgi:hypothetical protein
MTKLCNLENCPCSFHRTVDPSIPKKKGRPPVELINENHKKCRLCNEIKELSEMRPKRNECIACYNKSQREYYKINENYNKYKKSKAIEYKKKAKQNQVQPQEIEPSNSASSDTSLNYII